jgi:WD40 repeat protein
VQAFSPDGTRIVTASDDDRALVWDGRTGMRQLELKMKPAKGLVYGGAAYRSGGVAFSPDGTRIVAVGTAAGTRGATVWDARTGQNVRLDAPARRRAVRQRASV